MVKSSKAKLYFTPKTKVHFMGIGGSGMSAVAMLANAAGYEVDGCDQSPATPYMKELAQINIKTGHSKDHVKGKILVISPAISFIKPTPDEVRAAKKVITWQELLGKEIVQDKSVIAVAGTHGKSTTTAMLALIFEQAKLDPGVMIGAKVPQWNSNFRVGQGKNFIVEADEFNDNFLNYSPEIAIINNIEFDHPDYFKDEPQLINSFKNFISRLKGRKILIFNSDSKILSDLVKAADKDITRISYSLIDESADVYGKIVKKSLAETRFSVVSKKLNVNFTFTLKLAGDYNVSNALGAIAAAVSCSIDKSTINASLSSFYGIGRRMELLGKPAGVFVYDDYAHHPTAIRETLKALRQRHHKSRVTAVIEPHSFSRTKALLNQYKGVFENADRVIVAPIFKARDSANFGISSNSIVKVVTHGNIHAAKTLHDATEMALKGVKKGDVIIVMGAGQSNVIATDLVKALSLKIYKNYSLKKLNTFRVDVKAKQFVDVESELALKRLLSDKKVRAEKRLIIGAAANILFTKDFDGLVIKNSIKGISLISESKNYVTLEVGSGESWHELVMYSVKNGWAGIENLVYIPGLVGAAPVQNIAAYGQNFSDVFVSLDAIDTKTGKKKVFSKEDCMFGYRDSYFKSKAPGRFVVTKVRLKLAKTAHINTSYFETGKTFAKNVSLEQELALIAKPPYTIHDVAMAVMSIRKKKLPEVSDVGTVGSFFKNPVITKEKYLALKEADPDLQSYPVEDLRYTKKVNGEMVKIPAARLLDTLGWKGKKIGKVGTHPTQALAVVNYGAKPKDILKFTRQMQKAVLDKFGIELEPEVVII